MDKETVKYQPGPDDLTRREFLKWGVAIGGSLLTGCYVGENETPEWTRLPTDTLFPPTSTGTEVPPTASETPVPTSTQTTVPTPEPSPTATLVPHPYELTPEQLAERNLYGSGFEIKTVYEDIPIDITVVTSQANLDRYKQTQGCMINEEFIKFGVPCEERFAKAFFLGHYVGYLRYTGQAENEYTFERYMADLKSGKNMNYSIYGIKPDEDTGEFMVDPFKPVEFVVTDANRDDPNGRGTARLNDNASTRGYIQLENGGLRIIMGIAGENADMTRFCRSTSHGLIQSLITLGSELGFLDGRRFQLFYPGPVYPKTQEELYSILKIMQIYEDSDGKISSLILTAP